jgi:hypothetical protein
VSDRPSAPPPEKPALFVRLRGHLTLSRTQATAGIVAAALSIGGSVYGYLRVSRPPDTGELIAVVRDRADKPVADATVEVLTPKDALVTSFTATDPAGARRTLKEGTYRLRVSHPKFGGETRTVQVMAGQTSEIRFRLAPRAAAGAPPAGEASSAVSKGVEAIKKIFR